MSKKISFHPKFAAGMDALISALMFWALSIIGVWWLLAAWFFVRIVLWAILVRFVYYPKEISRVRHFISLCVFAAGSTLFLLFIEWAWAWRLMVLASIIFSAWSFWLLPPVESKLPFMPKPHRRWLLFLNLFGIAGMWSGVYAVSAFQILYNISAWVWVILISLIVTAISGWWWWEYGVPRDKRFFIWLAVWFVMMVELSRGVMFLPMGFFASGFFLTWIWYCLWLFARFNFTKEGINWKKQRLFIISNLSLMILFLIFVARWK